VSPISRHPLLHADYHLRRSCASPTVLWLFAMQSCRPARCGTCSPLLPLPLIWRLLIYLPAIAVLRTLRPFSIVSSCHFPFRNDSLLSRVTLSLPLLRTCLPSGVIFLVSVIPRSKKYEGVIRCVSCPAPRKRHSLRKIS
jgi:hypothetical protein